MSQTESLPEDGIAGLKVTIRIPKENREWGFNPVPDGTIAKALGWGTISHGRNSGIKRPGLYENRHWVELEVLEQDLDGKHVPHQVLTLSVSHVEGHPLQEGLQSWFLPASLAQGSRF